jgi:CheY-like chemotaxis protein
LEVARYESSAPSVASWFHEQLRAFVEELLGPEDEAPVFLINLSFKFRANARRAERHGFELVEHIRLTKTLPERVRWAPVVLYTFETAAILRGLEGNGAIVRSPGVALARLPDHLGILRDSNQLSLAVECLEKPSEISLRAFVRSSDLSDSDELDPHAYRNRIGVGKLCTEFAGDVLSSDHETLRAHQLDAELDLEMKRLLAVMPECATGDPPVGQEWEEFRSSCHRYKVLLVDDEHEKGWSLALLAGLSGQHVSPEEYRKYLDPSSNDSQKVCALSDAQAAWKRVDDCKAKFDQALENWNKASDALDDAQDIQRDSTHQLQRASFAAEQTGKATREAQLALQQAEQGFDQQKATARAHVDQFLAISTAFLDHHPSWGGTPDSEPDQALKSLEGSRRTLAEVSRGLESMAASGTRLDEAKKKVDKTTKALETDNQSLSKAREGAANASRRFQEAQRARNNAVSALTKAIPFQVALVDMRLDPVGDARQDIQNLSGIRLLRHLRLSFPPIPVLMLTASEKALSYQACIESGASAYWIKGISSGRELRMLLQRCFSQADLVDLWRLLQQVRVKSKVASHKWSNGEFVPHSLSIGSPERRAIDLLLEDSYRRIWERQVASQQEQQAANRAYNLVIINLGGVQEIRYQEVKDPNNNSYWFRTPKEDQELRKLRNDVAHAKAGTSTTRAEACKYLSYTLNQLLA